MTIAITERHSQLSINVLRHGHGHRHRHQHHTSRPIHVPIDPHYDNTIQFDSSAASDSASKIVQSWLESKLKDPDKNSHLPDLILTHAADWGLQ